MKRSFLHPLVVIFFLLGVGFLFASSKIIYASPGDVPGLELRTTIPSQNAGRVSDVDRLNLRLEIVESELSRAIYDSDRLELIIGLVGIGFGLLVAAVIIFFSLSNREIAITSAKLEAEDRAKTVYSESEARLTQLNKKIAEQTSVQLGQIDSRIQDFESLFVKKLQEFDDKARSSLQEFEDTASSALSRFMANVDSENVLIGSRARKGVVESKSEMKDSA